jgi:hypothetical protein
MQVTSRCSSLGSRVLRIPAIVHTAYVCQALNYQPHTRSAKQLRLNTSKPFSQYFPNIAEWRPQTPQRHATSGWFHVTSECWQNFLVMSATLSHPVRHARAAFLAVTSVVCAPSGERVSAAAQVSKTRLTCTECSASADQSRKVAWWNLAVWMYTWYM